MIAKSLTNGILPAIQMEPSTSQPPPLTEGIEETAEKVRSRKKRMSWPFVVSETKSKETTQVT